jgi:hypothetical protein
MNEFRCQEISDSRSQLISGGANNPSSLYGLGTTSYGQFKKSNPNLAAVDVNPSVAYYPAATNYGQCKSSPFVACLMRRLWLGQGGHPIVSQHLSRRGDLLTPGFSGSKDPAGT